LRGNVAGGIPDRQSTQNLTIMFADHTSYRPAFRKDPGCVLINRDCS
jgi:hypothetical protein